MSNISCRGKNHRYDKDLLDEHLQLDALPKIDQCKIRDRQHKNHYIPDADVVLNPKIFKVVTLLDVTIRNLVSPIELNGSKKVGLNRNLFLNRKIRLVAPDKTIVGSSGSG